MMDVYEYRQTTRRPAVWAAALAIGFLLGFMIWNVASWYIWAIWLPVSGIVYWYLLPNPVTGLRLTHDDLTLSPWQAPEVIDLKDVRFVRIVDWSDSTDIEVYLKNGHAARIQDCDMPPRAEFIDTLAARGVPVEIA